MMQMILASASGLYILLFSIAILSILARDRKYVENRLKDLEQQDQTITRQSRARRARRKKTPVSQALANELISADIRMRPEEFLVMWILLAILPSGLIFLLNAHPITVLAIALIGAGSPLYYVNAKKAKKLIKFEAQLSEAMVMIGNCLRSGMTFQQAMANIASEMPDPIGREFGRAVREISLGSSVDLALNNLAERVKSVDLNLAVSAIQIQRQVGGNLLDLLMNISETIKDRIKVKNEIRVLTATGRSSGLVIGVLPLGLAGVLMLINPSYVQSFFNTQLGTILIVVAAVMESIGFLLIKKVVSIRY